ncbi:MAG: hypothetical protein PHG16_10550 [Lachnospiraceae bacterium]|nr:hypothetical protein [Lachnospiraceae bacterium]
MTTFTKLRLSRICMILIVLSVSFMLYIRNYAAVSGTVFCLADLYMVYVSDWCQALLLLPIFFMILTHMLSFEERIAVYVLRSSRKKIWMLRMLFVLKTGFFYLLILYIVTAILGLTAGISLCNWNTLDSMGYMMNAGQPLESLSLWQIVPGCILVNLCTIYFWGGCFLIFQWMWQKKVLSWILCTVLEFLLLLTPLWKTVFSINYMNWRTISWLYTTVTFCAVFLAFMMLLGIIISKRKDFLDAVSI